MELGDRVVLITGARRGIGRTIAQAAATAGARVILHAREQGQAEDAARAIAGGQAAAAVWGDLESVATIRRVVDDAGSRYGRLDGIVNNAGIALVGASAEMTEADWDRQFAVNVKGAFFVCQAALPFLRRSPSPRVVNISSLHAESCIPGRAAYGASKAALSQLTRALAIEWAPYGIVVNAVAPGFVRTEQLAGLIDREGAQLDARTPLGRVAEPSDVAAAVLFFLSDQVRHITGEVVRIDGGWTLYGSWRPPAHERRD